MTKPVLYEVKPRRELTAEEALQFGVLCAHTAQHTLQHVAMIAQKFVDAGHPPSEAADEAEEMVLEALIGAYATRTGKGKSFAEHMVSIAALHDAQSPNAPPPPEENFGPTNEVTDEQEQQIIRMFETLFSAVLAPYPPSQWVPKLEKILFAFIRGLSVPMRRHLTPEQRHHIANRLRDGIDHGLLHEGLAAPAPEPSP